MKVVKLPAGIITPYCYKAVILEVIDGDTCLAKLDLGFHVSFVIKLRLAGINTPELDGPSADLAIKGKDRLTELAQGKEVIVVTEKDHQEKYGRYLASIFLHDSTNVNELLVTEGLAKHYFGTGRKD